MKRQEKLESLNLNKSKLDPDWVDPKIFVWEILGARAKEWDKYNKRELKL